MCCVCAGADGLLHNHATQSSQAIALCMLLDLHSEQPAQPSQNISLLTVGGARSALPHFWPAAGPSSFLLVIAWHSRGWRVTEYPDDAAW